MTYGPLTYYFFRDTLISLLEDTLSKISLHGIMANFMTFDVPGNK